MRALLRTPPLLLPTVLLAEFLPWYFLHIPRQIVQAYLGYARAFAAIFSLLFLLRTLASPWKNIADTYPANMLQLSKVLKVFTLNMTARCVGFVVRTITICIGLIVQGVLLVFMTTIFLFWITFPIIALLSIEFLMSPLRVV